MDTKFKKGMIPWNKGTKGLCKPNSGSFKKGERISIQTEFKSGENKGKLNNKWKGDNVGYFSLHTWVIREKGKAQVCSHCDGVENVQWANKSHKYKRDINDYIALCWTCHRKFDKINKLNDNDVIEIKSLVESGKKQKDIAKIFNIHQSTISKIINNHTWRNICQKY